jgi:hypothetical protein
LINHAAPCRVLNGARDWRQGMPLFPFDLAGAKDAVEELLTRLNLEAFLFAVEHTERGWELRVECATEDGWQAQTILLGDKLPAASEADAHLRSQLLALLEEKLAACKRRR